MKKAGILPALIIASALLSGCYPTGEIKYNITNNYSDNTESEIFDKEIVNFKFSADIPKEYPESAPVVRVKFASFDKDKATELLLGGESVVESEESEKRLFYKTENIMLTMGDGRISALKLDERSEALRFYSSLYYTEIYPPSIFPECMSELDNFSREEALSLTAEITDALGIKNLGEPIIYAAPAAAVNKYFAENESPYGKISFGEDEGFYSIMIPSVFEGIGITEKNVNMASVHHQQSCVKMVISKAGIINFSCMLPLIETEKADEAVIKVSPAAAAKSIYDFYALQKLEEPHEITGCRLVYATAENNYDDGNVVYSPVWEFSGFIVDSENNLSWRFTRLVDIKTGMVF